MTRTSLVKKTIEMIESGKIEDRYFSDDLVVEGVTATSLNKEQYVDFLDKLTNSVPDLNYNVKNISILDKDKVSAKVRLSGTNSSEFNIPDIPTHPATGKKFKLPQEIIEFEVRQNRITKVKVQENYDAGINGMINQLGINPY